MGGAVDEDFPFVDAERVIDKEPPLHLLRMAYATWEMAKSDRIHRRGKSVMAATREERLNLAKVFRRAIDAAYHDEPVGPSGTSKPSRPESRVLRQVMGVPRNTPMSSLYRTSFGKALLQGRSLYAFEQAGLKAPLETTRATFYAWKNTSAKAPRVGDAISPREFVSLDSKQLEVLSFWTSDDDLWTRLWRRLGKAAPTPREAGGRWHMRPGGAGPRGVKRAREE
jgi:hypothetical protein